MNRTISAHEVGEFCYCSRAWWLVRVRGVPASSGWDERRQGSEAHARHRVLLSVSRLAWRCGLALLLLAAGMAAIQALLFR